MRRYIIIAVLLLAAPVLAFQNEPDGFRDIKWGDALPDGMSKLGTEASFGGVDLYIRKEDKLVIGGANLDTIAYYFWQGQYIGASIITMGPGNWTALLDALEVKFGKGAQENPHIEKYIWPGVHTNIFANYREYSKEGTVEFVSVYKFKEMQAYAEQKAKEGADGGF